MLVGLLVGADVGGEGADVDTGAALVVPGAAVAGEETATTAGGADRSGVGRGSAAVVATTTCTTRVTVRGPATL